MSAVTTVAILNHQTTTCDMLAVRVLDYWRTQEPAPSREVEEERIRDYVLRSQLSDLAASRSAGDLVERFLPRSRSDAGSETVASLRRLAGLTTELCDAVAIPVAPLATFEAKIRGILNRVEVEQAELGRLLVVPDKVEQDALEPYLIPIQVAGIEAEGQYLAYLESIRPKDKGPTIHDRMNAWYQQVYLPGVMPSKKAFALFLKARKTNNGREMSAACRQMSTEVAALMRKPETFQGPDARLEIPLRNIYLSMRRLATQCTAGRSREVQNEMKKIQQFLGDAGRQMERDKLRP